MFFRFFFGFLVGKRVAESIFGSILDSRDIFGPLGLGKELEGVAPVANWPRRRSPPPPPAHYPILTVQKPL